MGQSLGRYRAAAHRLTLGRYRSGRAAASHRRTRTRASHAARLGDGDHNHHTDAYVFRCSVRWKNKVGGTQSSTALIDGLLAPAGAVRGGSIWTRVDARSVYTRGPRGPEATSA